MYLKEFINKHNFKIEINDNQQSLSYYKYTLSLKHPESASIRSIIADLGTYRGNTIQNVLKLLVEKLNSKNKLKILKFENGTYVNSKIDIFGYIELSNEFLFEKIIEYRL